MYQELFHTEEHEGFTIKTYSIDESTPLADFFELSDGEIDKLQESLEVGGSVYFCARVVASTSQRIPWMLSL
jgi:hypothetical protein